MAGSMWFLVQKLGMEAFVLLAAGHCMHADDICPQPRVDTNRYGVAESTAELRDIVQC